MALHHTLIVPVAAHGSALEQALRAKLAQGCAEDGVTDWGILSDLALRLGLIQNTLKPGFQHPQLVMTAGDHGLAVDAFPSSSLTTRRIVSQILSGRAALAVLAQVQKIGIAIIDAGLSDLAQAHPQLAARKIAHGTRNCRLGSAMTSDQAHAAICAGIEIADRLPGNFFACMGVGIGSDLSAALILSKLSDTDISKFVLPASDAISKSQSRIHSLLRHTQRRHAHLTDALDILAAMGGFEIAMLAGMMLTMASKHSLIAIDGLSACAALMAASHIAPSIMDYCVLCHSAAQPELQEAAIALAQRGPLLTLTTENMGQSHDGHGFHAVMAWPWIKSAAALLTAASHEEDAAESTTVSGREFAYSTSAGTLNASAHISSYPKV